MRLIFPPSRTALDPAYEPTPVHLLYEAVFFAVTFFRDYYFRWISGGHFKSEICGDSWKHDMCWQIWIYLETQLRSRPQVEEPRMVLKLFFSWWKTQHLSRSAQPPTRSDRDPSIALTRTLMTHMDPKSIANQIEITRNVACRRIN